MGGKRILKSMYENSAPQVVQIVRVSVIRESEIGRYKLRGRKGVKRFQASGRKKANSAVALDAHIVPKVRLSP